VGVFLLIVLELPYPPTNNTYYRNVTIGGQGRTMISAKGRKYAIDVAKVIGKVEPIDFRICMVVDVYPPDLRKRDLDGVLKALQDSITKAGFWADDELIDDLRVIRKHKVPGGKVVVHISEMDA
jgi:crossover junction endodeoxyribonuclease RusA